jgi:hypothetical protein
VGLRPLACWVASSNIDWSIDVYCECCVLSARGLCDGLIGRPDESCRVCVCVCVKRGQCGGPGPLVSVLPGGWGVRKKPTLWPSNAPVTGCEEVGGFQSFYFGKDQTSTT